MATRSGVAIQQHAAEILTPQFQISGQLETVGSLLTYINDAERGSVTLVNASLTPIVPKGPLQPFTRPLLMLRKTQIVLLYLSAAESRASVRPLVRRELLVAYTSLAVCRGYFHMSAEANVQEFLDLLPGELLPVTEARIFPLLRLPSPFPSEADLILLGRSHLQFYHPA